MCIGLPMQVIELSGRFALCRYGEEMRKIDMILVGEHPVGAWVLVFLDAARDVMTAEQAQKTADALRAIALVMQGETSVDHLFADLVEREPELPAHLKDMLPEPAE